MTRPRAVVCGTKFGRVYLSALVGPASPVELAGIVAQGSERSRRCAAEAGVPLYGSVDAVPEDVGLACVVVGSALNGGPGTELSHAFLRRGIDVLQEHPLHSEELAALVRTARDHGAVHLVNTLYPWITPVDAFIVGARRLLATETPVYVDGACSLQLKFSFFDIVGRCLGRLRPWAFEPSPPPTGPFTTMWGAIGGVPMSLRLQNQVHAVDPDNHAHLYHRLTIGTAGGSLTLVDTHGPVVWTPRPHIPTDVQHGADPRHSMTASLDLGSATVVAGAVPPTWRRIMTDVWPAGVRRAVQRLVTASGSRAPVPDVDYYLALTRLVQDVNVAAGAPGVLTGPAPAPRSPGEVLDAVAMAAGGSR